MSYTWGSFCQNYMSIFNQVCVGMEYSWVQRSVKDVTPSVRGWQLGFALTNAGGNGHFVRYGDIQFQIHFQIVLSLFWNGLGSFYSFRPASHWGYFWPNTGNGVILQ